MKLQAVLCSSLQVSISLPVKTLAGRDISFIHVKMGFHLDDADEVLPLIDNFPLYHPEIGHGVPGPSRMFTASLV